MSVKAVKQIMTWWGGFALSVQYFQEKPGEKFVSTIYNMTKIPHLNYLQLEIIWCKWKFWKFWPEHQHQFPMLHISMYLVLLMLGIHIKFLQLSPLLFTTCNLTRELCFNRFFSGSQFKVWNNLVPITSSNLTLVSQLFLNLNFSLLKSGKLLNLN